MEFRDSGEDRTCVADHEYAALFSAIFGESDTAEDSDDQSCTEERVYRESTDGYLWEKVEDVEGLWHCSNFLSLKEQRSLLKAIDSEGWFCDPLHNQAMRFGDLPEWANDLSTRIQSKSGCEGTVEHLDLQKFDQNTEIDAQSEIIDDDSPFPSRILEREPFFDQMIVNSYQPGEGIAAHVDLLRFEDGIAIVSLESTCVMSFRPVDHPADGVENAPARVSVAHPCHDSDAGFSNDALAPDPKETPHSGPLYCEQGIAGGTSPSAKGSKSQSHTCERDPISRVAKKVDVLLSPGDLIIASGPARYTWTHEINRSNGNQTWHGEPVVQRRRVSVTLRRLCPQKDAN